MTVLIGADDAARRLGVRIETLYAYVSRGRVRRLRGADGRSSLFDQEEIDALAARRRTTDPGAGLVPVRIESRITEIGEGRLRFRGHDAVGLADSAQFEDVAELLWTGVLRDDASPWVPPDSLHRAAANGGSSVGGSVFNRIAGGLLAAGRVIPGGDVVATARMLVSVAPSALGADQYGSMAKRLAGRWYRPPSKPVIDIVRRVLVLLADHELATCAMAARVAASTRADLAECLAVAMITLGGPLHGSASVEVRRFLEDAERRGVADAFESRRAGGGRVPGFGHRVYRTVDPRTGPLLAAVNALGADPVRHRTVETMYALASGRLTVPANVDYALGALGYVLDLPEDAAAEMFAVARLAGVAAHVLEEYAERPVRFRTTARYRASTSPE